MNNLKKQIKESFFNPILHLLPIFLFLVCDDYFGLKMAWMITLPFTILLLVYVYFTYNRVYNWHLMFTVLFIGVSSLGSIPLLSFLPLVFEQLRYEFVLVVVLSLMFFFRRNIQTVLKNLLSALIPMTNNFEEMYRVLKMLLVLLIAYLAAFLLVYNFIDHEVYLYLESLRYFFNGSLLFLIIYELIRVQIVRAKLIREEWWPVINTNGKVIGSIHHMTSINDEKKYLHPVVRVMIIEKGRILLQKRISSNMKGESLWDTAICNHVKMGETIDSCVESTAAERYGLQNFKYMYLSNYSLELQNEMHYAFLYVSCQQMDIIPNPQLIEQTKWWTQQQIEENIDSQIFTENFRIEFDLLKRSGLLESEKCECNCRLKDVIYNQPTNINSKQ